MSSTPASVSSLKTQLDQSHQALTQGMDIPWVLKQWVDRAPNKDFMIWEPFQGEARSWTYSSFYEQSCQFASGLAEQGVVADDFVLIHLDNSPEFVVAWFACAILGAVAVSTNTRSVARDLSYFADHVGATHAITQPQFASLVSSACPSITCLIVTDNDVGVSAEVPSDVEYIPFADIATDQINELINRPVSASANLSVQFTSGTTSRPKAVLWTHANGVWGGKVSASHMRLRHDDRTLIFMPMFHTNAQTYSMLATLWAGGTFVLQPKFSASRFWPLSIKHQITWLSTIPFAFKAIAAQPVPEHHYRFWGTAAYIPALKDAFGVDVIGWWGMTETLTHGIVTDVDHGGPHGTIGRQAPEYDIQIRTVDGSLAVAGERGHLFIRGVRGVSLFKEYYGNTEATEAAFDVDGWFDTGDLIQIGEHGDLFFSDRDKDMLKVGAENVAASEIEAVVMLSGLVTECAVVAQKHKMLDEVPYAFVLAPAVNDAEAKASLRDKLLAYCRENLADFKVPVDIEVVESLPRSTLEKVAKNELRSRLPKLE